MGGRILVGVDGSEASRAALAWAARDGAARGAIVEALLVQRGAHHRAGEPPPAPGAPPPPHAAAAAEGDEDARRRLLEPVEATAAAFPGVRIEPALERGDPAEVLCRRAAAATVLVLGASGRGAIAAQLLGSVARRCVRASPAPVVVVPMPAPRGSRAGPADIDRIVVGVDSSEGSLQALRFAIEEATARGWAIQAVHVQGRAYRNDADFSWSLDEGRGARDRLEMARGIEEAAGRAPAVAISPLVVDGDPGQRLLELARTASLLVVGGRRRSASASLLAGSVADGVIRHSPCPVAVVRPAKASDAQPHVPAVAG